jgi:hypothetical protein
MAQPIASYHTGASSAAVLVPSKTADWTLSMDFEIAESTSVSHNNNKVSEWGTPKNATEGVLHMSWWSGRARGTARDGLEGAAANA